MGDFRLAKFGDAMLAQEKYCLSTNLESFSILKVEPAES